MTPALHRSPDARALAQAAAERVVEAAAQAAAARGAFHLALSGGSTPKALYQFLAGPLRARVDWSRAHLWFGDERCYPPDHPDSNYRMAREAMLDALALPTERVHRIRGEDDPEREAARYAAEVKAGLPDSGGWPCLDINLLGMGTDGHTASLFPGTGAVLERGKVALAVTPGAYVKPQVRRVSLSAPVLQAARLSLVLVAGADKAEVLADVLSGPERLDQRPLQLVRQARGEVAWYVDDAAAARLG